jgi:hypothetical protein
MKVPYYEDAANHIGLEPHGGCGNSTTEKKIRRQTKKYHIAYRTLWLLFYQHALLAGNESNSIGDAVRRQ